MRQRDRDADIAKNVRRTYEFIKTEMADKMVEYADDPARWSNSFQRRMGQYVGLRKILWSAGEAPPPPMPK